MFEIGLNVLSFWIRCSLKNLSEITEEFIQSLIEKLIKLLLHDFIATQQSQYFRSAKDNLKTCDFVVTLDFPENFAFVVQEAVQGFPLNNNQATVHPFVIYYKNDRANKIEYVSYVGISDCLKHDTIAVHMFTKKLVAFLKKNFTVVNRIKYFSDGAPWQYKNKKIFINLSHHFIDFGVAGEWHFHAAGHGKGACDSVGGILKRISRRSCLQSGIENEILTTQKLYEWAVENLKNFNVFSCLRSDYESADEFLKIRFAKCKTINVTLSIHSAPPVDDKTRNQKVFKWFYVEKN